MNAGLFQQMLNNERDRGHRAGEDALDFQERALKAENNLRKSEIKAEALKLTAAGLLIKNTSLMESIEFLERKWGSSGILREAKEKAQSDLDKEWDGDPYFEKNGDDVFGIIEKGKTEAIAINSLKYKKKK